MSGVAYVDTGLLVKNYVREADSDRANAILGALGAPLPYSHIHELEIPNAIRLKRVRGEISLVQERAALRLLREDVAAGRLFRPRYDLGEVFRRAEALSARHTGRLGSRSLDLLHVAVALEIGCATFASLDGRQRGCAAREGLRVLPATR